MRFKSKFRPNAAAAGGGRNRIRRVSGSSSADPPVGQAATTGALPDKDPTASVNPTPNDIPASPVASPAMTAVASPAPGTSFANLASPPHQSFSPPFSPGHHGPRTPASCGLGSPAPASPGPTLRQPPSLRRVSEAPPEMMASPAGAPPSPTKHHYFPSSPSPQYSRTRHLSTTSMTSEAGSVIRQRRPTGSAKGGAGGGAEAGQVPASVFDKRKADHKKKFNNGIPERNKMTMFDLIYYNPSDGSRMSNSSSRRTSQASVSSEDPLRSPESGRVREDANVAGTSDGAADKTLEGVRKRLEEEEVDDAPSKTEEEDGPDDAMPVPQVKVGPNGEMIIDEESTIIETTAAKKAKEDLLRSPLVFESANQNSNYGSWGRRRKNVDWGQRETLRFYRALSVFGTDFSVMESVFRKRTRHELKMKFKKEERSNRALVDKCLREGCTFDPSAFRSDSEEDDDVDKEEERRGGGRKKPATADKKKARLTRKRVRKVRTSRGYYASSDADESEAANSESDSVASSPKKSRRVPSDGINPGDDIGKDLTAFRLGSPPGRVQSQRSTRKPTAASKSSSQVSAPSPLLKSLLSEGSSQTAAGANSSIASPSSPAFPPGLLAANPGLASAVPGSLLVVASPSQGDPQKHMLHVYRISGGKESGQAAGAPGTGNSVQTPNSPVPPSVQSNSNKDPS